MTSSGKCTGAPGNRFDQGRCPWCPAASSGRGRWRCWRSRLADVTPVVRSHSSAARIARLTYDFKLADALNEEQLVEAFTGCDVIFTRSWETKTPSSRRLASLPAPHCAQGSSGLCT